MPGQTVVRPAKLQVTQLPRWRRVLKENLTAYAFILPYFALFGLFMVYPIIQGFLLSLTERDIFGFDVRFVGAENYLRLLEDPTFWISVRNTARFALMAVPSNVILGLLLATLLFRSFRGRELSLTCFFVPRVLSISVLAFIWMWLYEPQWGLLNYYLGRLGISPVNWLRDTAIAMPAIVVASLWWTVGHNMILFLAGMQQIPSELYEAAKVDGASSVRSFFSITLPLLRPTMLFVLVTQVIASFQIFGQVYIMTGGGPAGSTRVLVQYIYETAFSYFELGYAAALSYILFLLIIVFSILQFVFLRER